MRPLLLPLPMLLAGRISFSETCGSAGVQAFSCKTAPPEGLEYQCQCKKPGAAL